MKLATLGLSGEYIRLFHFAIGLKDGPVCLYVCVVNHESVRVIGIR